MKYNNSPVQKEKIELITNMLQSQPVNMLWLEFVNLGQSNGTPKEREDAFIRYAKARDLYLGLKPLNSDTTQGTNNRYRM